MFALVILLAVVAGLFLTVNASQTETLGTVPVAFTYVSGANNLARLGMLTLPEGKWHVVGSSTVVQGKAVVPPLHAWILLREGQKS